MFSPLKMEKSGTRNSGIVQQKTLFAKSLERHWVQNTRCLFTRLLNLQTDLKVKLAFLYVYPVEECLFFCTNTNWINGNGNGNDIGLKLFLALLGETSPVYLASRRNRLLRNLNLLQEKDFRLGLICSIRVPTCAFTRVGAVFPKEFLNELSNENKGITVFMVVIGNILAWQALKDVTAWMKD